MTEPTGSARIEGLIHLMCSLHAEIGQVLSEGMDEAAKLLVEAVAVDRQKKLSAIVGYSLDFSPEEQRVCQAAILKIRPYPDGVPLKVHLHNCVVKAQKETNPQHEEKDNEKETDSPEVP